MSTYRSYLGYYFKIIKIQKYDDQLLSTHHGLAYVMNFANARGCYCWFRVKSIVCFHCNSRGQIELEEVLRSTTGIYLYYVSLCTVP